MESSSRFTFYASENIQYFSDELISHKKHSRISANLNSEEVVYANDTLMLNEWYKPFKSCYRSE